MVCSARSTAVPFGVTGRRVPFPEDGRVCFSRQNRFIINLLNTDCSNLFEMH